MTSLSRGRPSIAESELPQNIKIALANRVTGKTWKACAAEAGIAYSTLRDWLRNNPDAKYYLNENCDDFIDQSYFYMAKRSPEVAEELYKIITDKKCKSYVKAPAIDTWFRILDKGYIQRNIEQEQENLAERLDAVEGNKVIDMYKHN